MIVERTGNEPLVDAVLAVLSAAGWSLRESGPWVTARPPGAHSRPQGWKLHVSATSQAAPEVLRRATEVLLAHGCPFKFAATTGEVRSLNARHAHRGSSGKFLTAYPARDEDLPALAEALHAATEGLPGPQILSDRRYRPGSLVHYRYGGFTPACRLADSGVYEPVVFDPDGNPVPDRRDAWFTPPAWAPDPFATPAPAATGPRPVLIADRFVVRAAIRHANKGGVFRAVDEETGAEVIVKQGRAHVDELPGGGDVRDLLRHEAAMLDRLAGTGHVPAVVALLDVGEHTFLVTTVVPGVPLRTHWRRLHRTLTDSALRFAVRGLASRLVALLADVHAAGVVVRDLSPGNVLIAPDGRPHLIDLELAAVEGADALGAGTPGFAAPEQWSSADTPTPAAFPADLFALGALLFSLATNDEPVLAPDDDPPRRGQDRLAGRLSGAAADNPLVAELAPAALALLADNPADRCPLDKVLSRPHDALPAAPATDETDSLLRDGLAYLVATMAEPTARRLWPANAFGERTDPTCLYYGSAGILGVLSRAEYDELRPVLRIAAEWTAARAAAQPTVLPGLQFGRSGVAWSLLDCAAVLADDGLRDRAIALAQGIPLTSPIPDVCHGLAGAGLAQLHFWRGTGDPVFLERATACAETLLRQEEGLTWRLPAQATTGQSATVHYGFAHGTAGIAAFLLDCAAETGDPRFLALADRAARELCALAVRAGDRAGWPSGPGDTVPSTSWCGGASGIGSFLVRAWLATGEPEFLDTAEAAARAVLADTWSLPAAYCHGVAGNIDFLLDLADATGHPVHLAAARHSVAAIAARATRRGGLLVPPDDSGRTVIPGHHTGVAGVVGTLLRLRHGGSRLWMPPLPHRCTAVPGRAAEKTTPSEEFTR